MTLAITRQSAVGIDASLETVPGMDFQMSALNGNAELARRDVESAAVAVHGALLLRKGEETAQRFFARKYDDVTIFLVPAKLAARRTIQHGRVAASLALNFGGNRLRIEASRRDEDASSITFALQNRPQGKVWVPEVVSYQGEEPSIVGQHASDPAESQAGHDQLGRAAAHIGAVAVEVAEAVGFDGPLQPQVQLSLQSTLV